MSQVVAVALKHHVNALQFCELARPVRFRENRVVKPGPRKLAATAAFGPHVVIHSDCVGWFHWNESFLNRPVVFLDDVADALTTFEVPAATVFAEKVELDVCLLEVVRDGLVALAVDLVDF